LTVEDVFASGDLPRAAETLANMRHCLSAVGEVLIFPILFIYEVHEVWYICFLYLQLFSPLLAFSIQVAEFGNIRKQLEVLEDRLDTMVQPRLSDALSNRKVTYTLDTIHLHSVI